MGMKDFTTHLLNLEEGVFVRENPFDITSVRIRRVVAKIDAARDEADRLEKELDVLVLDLNERMKRK